MNKVIISGRVVRGADVRYSQTANGSMAVARYTLAVDRTFKKEGEQAADFISCIAFGKNGEFAEKYLHQGTNVYTRTTSHVTARADTQILVYTVQAKPKNRRQAYEVFKTY